MTVEAGQRRHLLTSAAATLQVDLTGEQADLLLGYVDLLQRWNGVYNLTSLRDPSQMLSHHIVDCLATVSPLRNFVGSKGVRLLDVGSGGGLPGAVLAIMCTNLQITCVDTVGKKAAFVRQVAGELKLGNLTSVHQRVEQMETRFDVICSRAFASLADFCRLTQDRLADQGVWMAMKGKRPEEEISALPAEIEVFHVEQLTVPGLDADRCLVWMRPSSA